MNALKNQVGGNHYKNMDPQPIEFIMENDLNFIQGNIVKYISRFEHKNGVEDLKKIVHYAKLGLELDNDRHWLDRDTVNSLSQFLGQNDFTQFKGDIVLYACKKYYREIVTETEGHLS